MPHHCRKYFIIFLTLQIFFAFSKNVHAQESVYLECPDENGKPWATVNIEQKDGRILYDNEFRKFTNTQWNAIMKSHNEIIGRNHKKATHSPEEYKISKTTNIQIDAINSSHDEISINRYTLVLKDKWGEYKCRKISKGF